jgi:hypothetical protein
LSSVETTGVITWTYEQLILGAGSWHRAKGGSLPKPPAVSTRSLTDTSGTAGRIWTYVRKASNGGASCACGQVNPCRADDRQMTTWSTKPDNSTTVSYFSLYTENDTCPTNLYDPAAYGLPGTPEATYLGANLPLRSALRMKHLLIGAAWAPCLHRRGQTLCGRSTSAPIKPSHTQMTANTI